MEATEAEDIEPHDNTLDEVDSCSIDIKCYFNDSYRNTLNNMAKDILKEKSAISLNELAADIGWKHSIGRTTKKQLEHIESIIEDWAGIAKHLNEETTVWHSPDDVENVVSWRGINAFGVPKE